VLTVVLAVCGVGGGAVRAMQAAGLRDAAFRGDVKAIANFLAQGVDVNAADNVRGGDVVVATAVHVWAVRGHCGRCGCC
jgi:hypothetical protein